MIVVNYFSDGNSFLFRQESSNPYIPHKDEFIKINNDYYKVIMVLPVFDTYSSLNVQTEIQIGVVKLNTEDLNKLIKQERTN